MRLIEIVSMPFKLERSVLAILCGTSIVKLSPLVPASSASIIIILAAAFEPDNPRKSILSVKGTPDVNDVLFLWHLKRGRDMVCQVFKLDVEHHISSAIP